MYKFVYVLAAALCAAIGAYAQNTDAKAVPAAPVAAQEKPVVTDVEVRAGARGVILVINGTGPIALGGKPVDFAKTTAKYQDINVNIAGANSVLGASATLIPPAELPIKELVLANNAAGVSVAVKMRSVVNGPIDVRASNNQVRILLTRTAMPEITWSSSKGVVAAGAKKADAPSAPPSAVATAPVPPPPPQKQVSAATPAPVPQKQASAAASAPVPQKQARTAVSAPQIATKSETPASVEEPNIKPDSQVTKKTPEGELVRYKVFGRDPFVPLMRDTTDTGLPRVENLRLVGVLEDARERIALVEDFKNGNKAFALRTNDAVEYGRVLRVHRDKVVFLMRDFDVSRSYTLGLSK